MPANLRWLHLAFWTAGSNWLAWSADFEFQGDVANLPVLVHQERYRVFVQSYRLLRYYVKEERQSLRVRLLDSSDFRYAVEQSDGAGIDKLALALSQEFPGFDVERSFISKLAAFARPDTFVAWDRFARKGVAGLTNGPTNGNYQSYAAYFKAVNDVLNDQLGDEIREFVAGKKERPTENRDAFIRRTLDVYLMISGGRWSTELAH